MTPPRNLHNVIKCIPDELYARDLKRGVLALRDFYIMNTTSHKSFLKFYVMTSTGIDLYGIAHVKVDFVLGLKMCVLPILGKFV